MQLTSFSIITQTAPHLLFIICFNLAQFFLNFCFTLTLTIILHLMCFLLYWSRQQQQLFCYQNSVLCTRYFRFCKRQISLCSSVNVLGWRYRYRMCSDTRQQSELSKRLQVRRHQANKRRVSRWQAELKEPINCDDMRGIVPQIKPSRPLKRILYSF